MARKKQARVLVVEDDRAIRSAVTIALQREGYDVRAEADGAHLETVFADFEPDLAILDVRLPVGPDGYDMSRQLRRRSDVPLLFLTAADSVRDRLAGFEAGGDDYLGKPFAMAELLARIQVLLRRSGRLSDAVREIGDLVIDEQAGTVHRAGRRIEITKTEYALLAVLARHSGHVLSKMQLLTHVWGYDAYDTNLVEVHMSALRQKLEAHGPRLIHTVRGMGYSLRA